MYPSKRYKYSQIIARPLVEFTHWCYMYGIMIWLGFSYVLLSLFILPYAYKVLYPYKKCVIRLKIIFKAGKFIYIPGNIIHMKLWQKNDYKKLRHDTLINLI